MTYKVFDLETQINKSHKRTANPFHPDNYVVMRGWKKQGDKRASYEYFKSKEAPDNHLRIESDVTLLIGHNIKFDLLYEMCGDNPHLREYYQRGGRIWDTQYAEYLINAHVRGYHMVSMDAIAESYGGRLKIDQIKAMWKAGIQTSNIDRQLLADYLIGTREEGYDSGDIGNTEKIFLGQLKTIKEMGMFRAVMHRMEGLLATIEMEYNGIHVDMDVAKVNLAELNVTHAEYTEKLVQWVSDIPAEVGFNWGSGTHTSCLIYGGTIKYKKSATYIDPETGANARMVTNDPWPLFNKRAINPEHPQLKLLEDGSYEAHVGKGDKARVVGQDRFLGGKRVGEVKTKKMKGWGEEKTKIQDFFHELSGHTSPEGIKRIKLTDGLGGPLYSTDSDTIELLACRDIAFLKDMGKLQALNKEIGTYYMRYDESKKVWVGMLTCVMPDGIVHHSLNHCATVTSRLSANNPNAQNFPKANKSKLKSVFTSRFTEEYCRRHGLPWDTDTGIMIEADYAQLEVVVQGFLSNDAQLIEDLNNRVDFHCKRVAMKYGITYEEAVYLCKDEDAPEYAKWEVRRGKMKIFSFQRAYGAGATLISAFTGMSVEDIKAIIVTEERVYKDVVTFNDMVMASCEATAEVFRDGDRGWRVFRKGFWQGPTGTMYSWRSYDAPAFLKKRGIVDTFKPTETKNYPVQGTGGEFVQMAIGRLWRYFMKKNNWEGRAFLVNTVHDCAWVDCHSSVEVEVAEAVKTIMESIPKMLQQSYNITCPVPFPVDVQSGPNMMELTHV